MHKMGPRDPEHYIFGDQFYSKCAGKLRFRVFLHFNNSSNSAKLFLHCDVSFWRNIQFFWTKLSHLRVFLVQQYTSLIYIKQKSFCLVNRAFLIVGLCISCIYCIYSKGCQWSKERISWISAPSFLSKGVLIWKVVLKGGALGNYKKKFYNTDNLGNIAFFFFSFFFFFCKW